jgi:hypothetical protein
MGALLFENRIIPFELIEAVLALKSYNWKVNGKFTEVAQSSQWLPMSVVPGTIDAPVDVVTIWPERASTVWEAERAVINTQ